MKTSTMMLRPSGRPAQQGEAHSQHAEEPDEEEDRERQPAGDQPGQHDDGGHPAQRPETRSGHSPEPQPVHSCARSSLTRVPSRAAAMARARSTATSTPKAMASR